MSRAVVAADSKLQVRGAHADQSRFARSRRFKLRQVADEGVPLRPAHADTRVSADESFHRRLGDEMHIVIARPEGRQGQLRSSCTLFSIHEWRNSEERNVAPGTVAL